MSTLEDKIPYVDFHRGISQTEHLNALANCAREAEAFGWDNCKRYMEHDLTLRMSDFKVAERRRVLAELAVAKSEHRFAWVILAAIAVVIILALVAMVTG